MVNEDEPGEQPVSSGDRIRRQHRFTVTPEHLILDPRVSDRAFRLWCRLDRFAGENESAYPTRETLCIELDCSPASIDRATKELVESGWLKRERMATGDRNLYTLIVAPDRDVERLVKAARRTREEESAPRREKRRQERRERKRSQAGKSAPAGESGAENPEVTEGGRITDDATPDQGGRITGDASPRITGEARGRITGDAQKEAPQEGSIREGGKTSSSETAGAVADQETSDDSLDAREDVTRVCEHLRQKIIDNGYKPVPNVTREWKRSARLLMDKDGRSETQVHNMIEWATSNDFWRPNIRSMQKLREHYAQMRERALQDAQKAEQAAVAPRRGDIDWSLAEQRAQQMSDRLGLGGAG